MSPSGPYYSVEFEPNAIANYARPGAAGELLAPGSRFTPHEIERLFEVDSPLIRENPYALAAPANTVRARGSDWHMFIRFCIERHYTPLPSAPVVVRELAWRAINVESAGLEFSRHLTDCFC
jgi:hypothetical protein